MWEWQTLLSAKSRVCHDDELRFLQVEIKSLLAAAVPSVSPSLGSHLGIQDANSRRTALQQRINSAFHVE
jgi:hypothetical protein